MTIPYHFSPDLIQLLIATIPTICRSKQDVIDFFQSAGVSEKYLADFRKKIETDKKSVGKHQITREVILSLNKNGEESLGERREIIKRVVEFNDFSRCWEGQQTEAFGLVAKVREMVNHKDYLTKIYELQSENERKQRQVEEDARLEVINQKRQKRQEIKSDLSNLLYKEDNPQKRGKKLESVLNRLFEFEGILVRDSFTIKGENQEGIIQQIDGAIEVNSHLYLVEMKWWKDALGPNDVSQHMMRILLRPDARGIFISASGYTNAALTDIKKALTQKTVVLFTLKEFVLLLEKEDSFESLLKSKVEAVQLEEKLLFDI
ncbi:MAG: restriction endonuclease [Nostocales cyanobacterium LacPavin_0920_SED1_MAG_38_18]|jgi:restriction system protein|nr:restriction endonuclease [Nostocales cyanobacterium LacPavin_0920_SED1_MAG_38_18]